MRRASSFGRNLRDMQDSLAAAIRPQCGLMDAPQFIKTRVAPETKVLVQTSARRQLLTESVWLRRVVDEALRADASAPAKVGRAPLSDGRSARPQAAERGARFMIRMRAEDRRLLRERAAARGMAAATYVAVVMRSHLRNLPPLPKDELLALKRSVAELGAIGRNLNQIARAANQGVRAAGATREELRMLIKVCEVLRENVRGLIKANASSWEIGHAEDQG